METLHVVFIAVLLMALIGMAIVQAWFIVRRLWLRWRLWRLQCDVAQLKEQYKWVEDDEDC